MRSQFTHVLSLALMAACASLAASPLRAEIVQVVNRIDPDPEVPAIEATFGNPGDAMIDDGGDFWATPATFIRDFPSDATADQARFVVFGETSSGNLYTSAGQFDNYDFRIHFWVDPYSGITNSPGSFESNPRGRTGAGHFSFPISSPGIAVFDADDSSFLITVDLAPLEIQFEEGRDYAMALVAENDRFAVRNDTVFLIASNWFEIDDDNDDVQQDLFASADPSFPPGLTVDDHGFELPAYATSLSVLVPDVSLLGDLTGNGAVDFEDLTVLLAAWNTMVSAAEGNLVNAESSPVNFEDLTVLLAHWTGPAAAGAADMGQIAVAAPAVPEPSTFWLALAAAAGVGLRGARRRSRSANGTYFERQGTSRR
ncbi:MAG: hypothetical protein IID44_08705 [Planctomycetes bacterium]|nr:hypothetical protein [Planctomycetota bacterium]